MKKLCGTIEINRLRLHACHGVNTLEKILGNEFEVSVAIDCEMDGALRDDRLDATVNYADIIETIKDTMGHSCDLIEHAAFNIASAISSRYPAVSGGRVKVAKLTPPVACDLESAAAVFSWEGRID